jgi:copper oxidase (laccase) domain-containing protein
VHGAGVAVVDRSSPGRIGGVAAVDALVTAEPGLGLVVLAADCLPVLLADPPRRVVGAVHAGPAGAGRRCVQAALWRCSSSGRAPRTTSAVLGPAACGGCYEVPPELADAVAAAVPGSRSTTRGAPARWT